MSLFACFRILFAQASAESGLGFLVPMLIIGVLFYLMVLRPEQQKRKDHTRLLAELKKNDRVVTIGGIYGTVVNAPQGEDVTIKVDDSNNTKLRILRSAISRVINDSDAADEKDKK